MEVSNSSLISKNIPNYQQYNQTIQVLPADIIDLVIACLNAVNVYPLSLINKFWNERLTYVFQTKDFFAMSSIANILSNHLSEDLYPLQKRELLRLAKLKNLKRCNLTIDREINYLIFRESIREILIKLPKKVSNELFDSLYNDFEYSKKTKIFYDVIFLSEYYLDNHNQFNAILNSPLRYSRKINEELKKRTLPTDKSLAIVLEPCHIMVDPFKDVKELLKLLIKFGARGTTHTLEILLCMNGKIPIPDFEEILIMLLNSDAIPTTDLLDLAIRLKCVSSIKIFIKFGVIPTVKTLNFALNYLNESATSPMDKLYISEFLILLLDLGVIPNLETLNLGIQFLSKNAIKRILDYGIIPTIDSLKLAKDNLIIVETTTRKEIGYKYNFPTLYLNACHTYEYEEEKRCKEIYKLLKNSGQNCKKKKSFSLLNKNKSS